MIGRVTVIVVVAVLTVVSCRTAALPQPSVVPVPPGMTAQQREVAILAGILNTHPPATYDPMAVLSEQEFNSLIWQQFVGTARGRSWFPESRDGNVIYAAVDTRGHYLRAAIKQEADGIHISIVESRNLSQTETEIHKRAVKWIENLQMHIRREIGRMSVLTGRSA